MKRARLLGLLTAVLAVTAFLGSAAQPASAGLGVACDQADLQVRGGGAESYLGDNIYNNDGDFQTKARKVRPGHTDGFQILLQNDGSDCSSSYVLVGDSASPGFTVHYFSGSTDITADVEAGTYITNDLPLNGTEMFTMTITAAKKTPSGAVEKLLLTAETKGSSDTIGAKDTVRPKAGDIGGTRQN
jgi:hypothetical protein